MQPLVREDVTAPVAVTPSAKAMAPVNAITRTPAILPAGAAKPGSVQSDGDSPLVARRKRWARLSNRH